MMRHIEFLPEPLPSEPLVIVNRWLAEAWQHRHQPNPNSLVLATSDRAGRPSARVVLCKEIVPQPGYLVFYTNYLSQKGRQLAENPRAAAVMHWDALHRQVRIEGPIAQAPAASSGPRGECGSRVLRVSRSAIQVVEQNIIHVIRFYRRLAL